MKIKGLLLDVEGVLVADKRYQAVEGAIEFVGQARRSGCPIRLITNNTTDDKPAIIEKLAKAGFGFALKELHTCTAAAVRKLYEVRARRCLVLGSEGLKDIFRSADLVVVDDSDVDAVVVGLDTGLTFERLRLACDAIANRGARFIALHRNRLYPDSAGRASPSVGAIAAAIEYATRVEPAVMGKPSREYYEQVLDDIGLAAEDVLLVSDDPFSDLVGAKRMGMNAAFVLSGKYADATILNAIPVDERPDITAPRIGDLITGGALETIA